MEPDGSDTYRTALSGFSGNISYKYGKVKIEGKNFGDVFEVVSSSRRDLVDPYFLDKQEQDEVFALLEEMNRKRDILFNQNEGEIKSPHPSCSLRSQSTLSGLGEGYRLQFINSISKIIIVFKFYAYMLVEE